MDTSTVPDSDADESPASSDPIRAIVASVGITLAGVLVSVFAGIVFVVPMFLFGLDVQSVLSFLVLAAVGQLGFLLVAYTYTRIGSLRIHLEVPDRREIGYAVGGAGFAFLLAIGFSFLLVLLGLLPGSVIGEAGIDDPSLYLGLAILSIVLVAPAEEFLFRGVIQARLRQSFGPVGAIAGASLLFGSIHLANYTGSIGPIIAGASLIVVVGAVFGILYERTGNLVVPILAHGAYNVVAMVLAYLGS